MDDEKFDQLARSFGSVKSRRGFVHWLAGSAVGAVVGGLGGASAGAGEKRAKGRDNRETRDCPRARRCGRACCKRGQRCRGGRCQRTGCEAGTKPCGGRCIPRSDCCRGGEVIPNGGTVGQCGICFGGLLTLDPAACELIDEDGCSDCDTSDFRCRPKPDGARCRDCGTCDVGLCEDQDPANVCGDTCCSSTNETCCAGQCCFGTCCNGECCPSYLGKFCDAGTCRCAPNLTPCGNDCCSDREICDHGVCTIPCPPDTGCGG